MTSEADTKFWKRPIVVAFTLFLIGAFTDPTLNTGWGVLVGALLFVFGALSIVQGIRELRPRGRKKGKRR